MLRPVETGLWTDATCAAAASAAESDNMTRDRQHDVVEACDRGMWRMSSSEALCSTWSTHGLRRFVTVDPMDRCWARACGREARHQRLVFVGQAGLRGEESTRRPPEDDRLLGGQGKREWGEGADLV